MSAALQRRDEGCASDLTMDRWLLGELPGSDEGRRLEQHVKACTGCAARFQALRSLYGSRPQPKAEPPLPPLAAPPRVLPPEHAAVLQIVILRDGLLVGTEVFTAGRYTVGRDPSCALRLDELAPLHAAISLQGERVALEAAGGPVFVNGFRATACELRPIDEVAAGPYVLRARVIAERWPQKPALKLVEDEQLPLPRRGEGREALKLELFWGDARVEVRVEEHPKDLSDFGITRVEPIDGGWQLDGLRVAHGESQRFHVGHLVCVASSVPAEKRVKTQPLAELPWKVLSLAAMLFSAVVALGIYGDGLEQPDFTPKEIPKAVVHVFQQPKPAPKPSPQKRATQAPAPKAKPQVTQRPSTFPPRLVDRRALDNVLSSLDKLTPAKAGKGTKSKTLVSLGAPSQASGIGSLGNFATTGIGSSGLRNAGGLKTGNIGSGAVQGTVSSASPRSVQRSTGVAVDKDAIAKVINEHLREISACYERAMMKSGAFGGSLTLEWTIAAPGNVTQARVKQTDIGNAGFGSCVLGALKSWRFPAMNGSATVSYPLHLNHVGY